MSFRVIFLESLEPSLTWIRERLTLSCSPYPATLCALSRSFSSPQYVSNASSWTQNDLVSKVLRRIYIALFFTLTVSDVVTAEELLADESSPLPSIICQSSRELQNTGFSCLEKKEGGTVPSWVVSTGGNNRASCSCSFGVKSWKAEYSKIDCPKINIIIVSWMFKSKC